jgi:hypothetical protein
VLTGVPDQPRCAVFTPGSVVHSWQVCPSHCADSLPIAKSPERRHVRGKLMGSAGKVTWTDASSQREAREQDRHTSTRALYTPGCHSSVGVLETSRVNLVGGDVLLNDNNLWKGSAKGHLLTRVGHGEVRGGRKEVRGGQGRPGDAQGASNNEKVKIEKSQSEKSLCFSASILSGARRMAQGQRALTAQTFKFSAH